MSYSNQPIQEWTYLSSTTPDNVGATGDAAEIMVVAKPITIIRIAASISTVLSGAATVKFDRRVTIGSDTGRGDGDVGTLTIPTTTAAGKVVYKDITPFDADPGDEIVPEVTSAASSGAARYHIFYRNREEVPANLSDMVASA